MFIQHHGASQQKKPVPSGGTNLIQTDTIEITAPYVRFSYSDYCAINVTPDTVSTTLTAIDTGQGTSWATISPTSGTGDYSFRARMLTKNAGSTDLSMKIRITDNAGLATPVDVTLIQFAEISA